MVELGNPIIRIAAKHASWHGVRVRFIANRCSRILTSSDGASLWTAFHSTSIVIETAQGVDRKAVVVCLIGTSGGFSVRDAVEGYRSLSPWMDRVSFPASGNFVNLRSMAFLRGPLSERSSERARR